MIKITECDGVYHWTIVDADGNTFAVSAYHTSKAACEQEAAERLEYYQNQGWI